MRGVVAIGGVLAAGVGLANGLRVPTAVPRHVAVAMSAAPPPGFEWGLDTSAEPAEQGADLKTSNVRAVVDMTANDPEATAEAAPVEKRQAYFCNDEGCWIAEQVMCDETGCWIDEPDLDTPVTLPDGRSFSFASGVEGHKALDDRGGPVKRVQAPVGLFAPAVIATKTVMGEKELNKLRGEAIGIHSKVISAFVDTQDSPFGQIVLKQMFEAADKDDSGGLDREEVREALHALGFKFIKDKQIDTIFARADLDGNEVIDFEEFVKETPKTLRSSLIKLAKTNGHDLGFLA